MKKDKLFARADLVYRLHRILNPEPQNIDVTFQIIHSLITALSEKDLLVFLEKIKNDDAVDVYLDIIANAEDDVIEKTWAEILDMDDVIVRKFFFITDMPYIPA